MKKKQGPIIREDMPAASPSPVMIKMSVSELIQFGKAIKKLTRRRIFGGYGIVVGDTLSVSVGRDGQPSVVIQIIPRRVFIE